MSHSYHQSGKGYGERDIRGRGRGDRTWGGTSERSYRTGDSSHHGGYRHRRGGHDSERGERKYFKPYSWCEFHKEILPADPRPACSVCKSEGVVLRSEYPPSSWKDFEEKTGNCSNCGVLKPMVYTFKCCSTHSDPASREIVFPLVNVVSSLCDAHSCPLNFGGSKNYGPVIRFGCTCNCMRCIFCFREYIRNQLKPENFKGDILEVKCPAGKPSILDNDVYRLLEGEDLKKYRDLRADKATLRIHIYQLKTIQKEVKLDQKLKEIIENITHEENLKYTHVRVILAGRVLNLESTVRESRIIEATEILVLLE